MKSVRSASLAGALLVLASFGQAAEISWVMDAMPAAVMINYEADDFDLRRGGQFTPAEEEEMSLISALPSASLGVSFEQPSYMVDFKAGVGGLLNSRLGAFMVSGTAGLRFEPNPGLTIGPHVTIAYFAEPTWWGDAEIDFDDDVGYMLGLHVTMGDKVSYLFSVDYVDVAFDIEEVREGWVPSDPDELDMSGVAVQFGVRVWL